MKRANEVLASLSKYLSGSFSINQIARTLGRPYGTVWNEIKQLEADGYIKTEVKGKGVFCSLNLENSSLPSRLAVISQQERHGFSKKEPILSKDLSELTGALEKRLIEHLYVVALFSSHARGKAQPKSDVDLLVIVSRKEETVEQTLHEECNGLELRYGKEVSPVILTPGMFINMLKDKEENIGKQALSGHIIFLGPENFWRFVLEGMK